MGDTGPEFERFFREEYRAVVRTLVPILGDVADAEALAQDAFVKSMMRWSRIRGYERPGAWVRRVAIRDAVRAAKRTPRPTDVAPATSVDSQSDIAARLDLYEAMKALSVQQRAAVALHHLAGWPVAEIAEALGCADATVRVHLHRARRSLGQRLSTELSEVCDEPR